MQALIDFDGWRKWKDFSSSNTIASAENKNKSPGTKTKTVSQSTGTKETTPPRNGGMNGLPSGGPKSKRAMLMHHPLDGIGEEGRERSTSDETDNTTDSNAEEGGSKVVTVGA